MAKASYTTQFEIDELWVAGDALGAQVQFNRDGWDVTIRIPASPSDFRMTEMQGFKTLGAFGHSSSPTLDGISRVQTVRVVQVSVAREEPFGAATEDQNAELVSAFFKEAQAVARSVASEFVQWVRVRREQTWLGMSHAEPQIVGLRAIYDQTEGRALRRTEGDPVVLRPLPIENAVDAGLVEDLAALLGDGRPEIPIADSLIADARYLVLIRPPNPQLAVLLAAVGLEVAVKSTLRSKVDTTKLALLDYILANPRDVSQQAQALFGRTMDTAIGRSLETDNKPLFKRVGKLFEWRNKVAHTGSQVPFEEAKDLAEAAREVLAWLSSP
jgi:hypothetical protein